MPNARSPITLSSRPDDMPRRGTAIAAMFLSAVLFSLMTLCTKATSLPIVGTPIPASEVTFFRFLFGFLAMLPLLWVKEARLLGQDRIGLLWRGLTGALAVFAFFVSLKTTSLAHAVILNYTFLVFGPVLAAILLKERIGRRAGVGIVVAVVGIVLITRPESGPLRSGDAWGLASGLLAGLSITTVRRLRQTETSASILFYFSAVGIPVALLGWIAQPPVWPTPMGWLILLAVGALSMGAQFLMTYGYRYVRTAEGVLLMLSQIVYTAAASTLVFGEPLTVSTWIGGALVVFAAVQMAVSAYRVGTRQSA